MALNAISSLVYIAIDGISIILIMFNMLKTKIRSRNDENNSLWNIIAIMG